MIPQRRQACIDELRAAFNGCPKPSTADLAPWGGLDAQYVIMHWSELDRSKVCNLLLFSDLAEDLSYMSSVALRYYLPEVLVLCLEDKERVDFGGIIGIISRLEGLFSSGREAYRPISISKAQKKAIHSWCGEILVIQKTFGFGSFESDYRTRLKNLRNAIRCSVETEDYDAEYFQKKLKPQSRTSGYRQCGSSSP
jgi:hypothetical protein